MKKHLDQLPNADHRKILALLEEKKRWLGLGKKGVERFRRPCESVRHIRADHCDFSGDVVKIGDAKQLSEIDFAKVHVAMRDDDSVDLIEAVARLIDQAANILELLLVPGVDEREVITVDQEKDIGNLLRGHTMDGDI